MINSNKNTKVKKANSFYAYMLVMVSVLAIMLLAPSLNKNIYAATFVDKSDIIPEVLSGESVKNIKPRKESLEESSKTAKLYELLSKKPYAKSQAENLDFSKTKEPIQDAFTFAHKDNLNLVVSGQFVQEGKMFDPVGDKRIEEGFEKGYSLTELNEDAGIFCIEQGAPLKGIPRGHENSNPNKQANLINEQIDGRTGLGAEEEEATKELIGKFAEETKKQNDRLLSPGTKEQILSQLKKQDASGSTAEKMSDNNVTIARPVVKETMSTPGFGELKKMLESQGVQFVKDNNGGFVVPSEQSGILYAAIENLKTGIKMAQANQINVEGAVIAVKSLEKNISDAEANIAYMLSEYEKKFYGENRTRPTEYMLDQLSNLTKPHRGQNSIQAALWSSEVAKQPKKWAKNALARAADDFKAYWKDIRAFEERAMREGDRFYEIARNGQRLLFGDGYWKHPVVSQNKDSGRRIGAGSADGKTNTYAKNQIVLKNPQVKYQPKILPGSGSTIEQSKVVNFDKDTQKWIMGPFKVDYVMAGTSNDKSAASKDSHKISKGDLGKYFAGITKVHLYGKYEEGDSKEKTDEDKKQEDKWNKTVEGAINVHSKFNLTEEEKAQGLSEVKSWRMKIARNAGEKYGPGMKEKDKDGQFTYGIPAPNEDFYFEVDYDPSLKAIVKARFEFAYMVFSGVRREYRLYGNTAQIDNVTKKVNVQTEPVTYKPEGYEESGESIDTSGDSSGFGDILKGLDALNKGLQGLEGIIDSFRRPTFVGKAYKFSSNQVVNNNQIVEKLINANNNQENPFIRPEGKDNKQNNESGEDTNGVVITPPTTAPTTPSNNGVVKTDKDEILKGPDGQNNKNENTPKPSTKNQEEIEKIKDGLTSEEGIINNVKDFIKLLNDAGTLISQLFNSPKITAPISANFGIASGGGSVSQTSGGASGEGTLQGIRVTPIENSYEATAEGTVKTAQQQTLMGGDSSKWIEEIALEIDFTNTVTPDPEKTPINLMVPIAGEVWEDKQGNDKKHVGFDNLLGSPNDVNLDGIKVTIFRNFVKLDSNGNVNTIIDRQYARLHDASGKKIEDYKNIYTVDGKYGPYYVHDLGFTKEELKTVNKNYKGYAVVFDVRFDYDGLNYEPVMPMQVAGDKLTAEKALANVNDYNNSDSESKEKYYKSSLAFENSELRDRFNAINGTIAGKTQLSDSGQTLGKTIPVESVHTKGMPKDGRTIEYKLNANVFSDSSNIDRVESVYQSIKPKGSKFSPNVFMNASTLDLGIKLPANDKVRYDGGDKEISKAFKELSGVYFDAKSYMLHVNLGLKKRTPVNVQVQKALNNAMLTVNKKAYVYNYADVDLDMLSEKESKDAYGNTINLSKDMAGKDKVSEELQPKLDIYKTDYIYRTSMYNTENRNPELNAAIEDELKTEKALDKQAEKTGEDINPRELDVFLTYRINVSNQSAADIVNVNAIDDYYNDKMELVEYDIKKLVETDPKKSVEDSNSGGLSLEQKEVDIIKPSYIVRSGADALTVPSTMPKIGEKDEKGNVSKAISTQKLSSASNKYKSDVKLPDGVSGARITGADKTGIVLGPDEAANIYLTFRVKKVEEVRELLKDEDSKEALGTLNDDLGNITKLNDSLRLGDFSNVAELAVFTTYDATTKKASGKILETSAPDNISTKSLEILKNNSSSDKAKFEVDTDNASTINIRIAEDDKKQERLRKLKGIVWEDKRNTQNKGIETGDGQFDPSTEKGIKGQPVTLEERISIKASNDVIKKGSNLVYNKGLINGTKYVDIPFVWPDRIKSDTVEIHSLSELNGYKSTVTTDDNGVYEFRGIPAGNMVVTLDYSSPGEYKKARIYKTVNGKEIVNAIQKTNDIDYSDLVPTVDYENRDVKFYNGLDFKNTMFYSKGGNSNVKTRGDYYNPLNVDKTWLSKDKTDTPNNSYLRDDEIRRVEITQLFEEMNNSNISLADIFRGKLSPLNTAGANDTEAEKILLEKLREAHKMTSMRATTPKMNFSIEYYEKLDKIKGTVNKTETTSILDYSDLYAVDGIYKGNEKTAAKDLGYDVNHINLGLVERPNTKIVMNKEIKEINLKAADGNDIVNIKYNIKAKVSEDPAKSEADLKYGETISGNQKVEFIRELDKKNSTGFDNVLELNRSSNIDGKLGDSTDDGKFKSGFKYINVDEKLLQDATLNIKYAIYAYNLGNIDRKIESDIDFRNPTANLEFREIAYRVGMDVGEATLNHHADPGNFGFGRFTGLEYYMFNNENSDPNDIKTDEDLLKEDDVSDVVITNVMEITDNDTNLNLSDPDNQDWNPASKEDLSGLLQNNKAKTADLKTDPSVQVAMKDANGTDYIKDNSGSVDTNIYTLKTFSKSIKPFKYLEKAGTEKTKLVDDLNDREFIETWSIKPSSILANGSNSGLTFENVIELVGYKTSSGARNDETPGNIMQSMDEAYENGKGVIIGDNTTVKSVPNSIKSILPAGTVVENDKMTNILNKGVGGYHGIAQSDLTSIAALTEHDSASTEIVTLSTPTGLDDFTISQRTANIALAVISVSALVTMYVSNRTGRKELN